MKFPSLHALVLLAALPLAAQAADTVTNADKPRSLPEEGPVAVSWNDPAQFSEVRHSFNRWEAERGDWVKQLAEHLRKSAGKQLQPGERLEVNIVDIQRAGQYEPWRGPSMDHVRIVRDRYPPRMELNYTLYGADGQVLAQGDDKFSDLGFMLGSSPINQNDPLRYEKRMIDDWVRRDMRAPRELSSR
ncbi:MAG: DUF3016 domain-containing protein [Pseudoxanthomonas sp.]